MRPLRFLGKKRGDRRTGSQRWASAGEAFAYGVFLLAGVLGMVLILGRFVGPEWRANQEFVEGRATVVDKRLWEELDHEQRKLYRADLHIRYQFQERDYTAVTYDITRRAYADRVAQEAILRHFEIGQSYPCWINPADPAEVVLVRGYTWWLWLMLILPMSFLVMGGVGLVWTLLHWRNSIERRAVTWQQARLLVGQQLRVGNQAFPAIPRDDNITNSPGTRLPYRLPIEISSWWKLLGLGIVTFLWNGIVLFFVARMLWDWTVGTGSWAMTLFLLPFVFAGGVLITRLVQELSISFGIGPTQLEISRHPLSPGEDLEVWISQGGRFTMSRMTVELVCEESATYRQGTDSRTETRVVHRSLLWEGSDLQVVDGAPLEINFCLTIPRAAMHTFQGAHNEIYWKILMNGVIAGWPPLTRAFSLMVLPAGTRTVPFIPPPLTAPRLQLAPQERRI
ncbi:MAG: DUF3592 domain-containing protein [Pirellulales bacterium]|nr:DUF3592 domain-containing protein [Pirellulales bacterium]